MAKTEAHARKQMRQEEMRAYLRERGKLTYVLDNIEKMEQLDSSSEHFQKDLLKLKTANEQRIRLLNKYLPDLKDDADPGADRQPVTINLVNPLAEH